MGMREFREIEQPMTLPLKQSHPLATKLVAEIQYDHFTGGRFRHGTKFLRWRPDKKPAQCKLEQVKG
jgi:ATP-dependent DNA ligase